MSPLDVSMATAALVVVVLDLLFTAAIYLWVMVPVRQEIRMLLGMLDKTNHEVDSIKGRIDKMRVCIPMGPVPVRSLGEGELYTCSQCGKKYHPVGPNGSVNNKCPDCLSKYPLHPVVRQG